MTSTYIASIFLIKQILCNLTNDLSIKHAEAPKSIKAWVLIFLEPKYIGIIKQGVGSIDRTGLEVVDKCVESSHTVPIVARHCHFSVVYLQFGFKAYVVISLGNHQLCVPIHHNRDTNLLHVGVSSLIPSRA